MEGHKRVSRSFSGNLPAMFFKSQNFNCFGALSFVRHKSSIVGASFFPYFCWSVFEKEVKCLKTNCLGQYAEETWREERVVFSSYRFFERARNVGVK